ncbi:hypothetical protein [Paracidovorax sp. MALMAid1276]|uniref:hypothetical protein n=1 Tax=Paracidovorax sp. MALMAid1276 TaxID=3411631 RepID=UPI003B9C7966
MFVPSPNLVFAQAQRHAAVPVLQMGEVPVGNLSHQRQQADPDVCACEPSDVDALLQDHFEPQRQHGDCGGALRQACG